MAFVTALLLAHKLLHQTHLHNTLATEIKVTVSGAWQTHTPQTQRKSANECENNKKINVAHKKPAGSYVTRADGDAQAQNPKHKKKKKKKKKQKFELERSVD